MDKPLSDPVLEAAAQIWASTQSHTIHEFREYFFNWPSHAKPVIEVSARHVDALRAAGHIPEKTNDQT